MTVRYEAQPAPSPFLEVAKFLGLSYESRRTPNWRRRWPVVRAVMNNNYEDQGLRNAKTLSKLLKVAQQQT
jgi:hypothetical protein